MTDRPSEGRALQAALGRAQASILAIHQATQWRRPVDVIICDITLDNLATNELLRAALVHLRSLGPCKALFLVRDPSHLTRAMAMGLGATTILPCTTPRAEIVDVARALKAGSGPGVQRRATDVQPSAGQAATTAIVTAGVATARSSLDELFKSARDGRPASNAVLRHGGEVVIGVLGQAGIRAWLDIVWQCDDTTYQHCLLVAGLAAAFSAKLGLSLPHQRLLSEAALICDIGKARIPYRITTKAGALTPDEVAIMQTHAVLGYEMLAREPIFGAHVLDIVRHHHEFLDGSGYPDRLTAPQISQFVRIITICDVYAALIEARAHRPSNTPETAYAMLSAMVGKLDRGLVSAFERVIRPARSVRRRAALQAAG